MRPSPSVLIQTSVRYLLTVLFVWLLIYPETGVWTALAIFLITCESEYQHGRRQGWWK